jgi:predicted amino acid-binding ACT domain protein
MAISIKASERGLVLMDQARRQRGWRKQESEWMKAAAVSPASVKRFWLGQAIKQETFIALCEAIGVDWQEIAGIDTTTDVPGVVEKMKHLFIRTVELDLAKGPKLDEATEKTLCYGLLFELFTLMVKAVEIVNVNKGVFKVTQGVIHKISTLFESQPDKPLSYIAQVLVVDQPGSLYAVTGVFAHKQLNIHQIHIVAVGEDQSVLKIYYYPSDKQVEDEQSRRDLEKELNQLLQVEKAEVWKLGEPPTKGLPIH